MVYLSSYSTYIPTNNNKSCSSDIALPAAKKACKGIDVGTIDGVIFATMTRDYVYPSSACMLTSKLGIKNAFAFDIDADFTGFISALILAKSFIKSNRYKRILVVAGEALSIFSDNNLFMDGAVATLLTSDIEGDELMFTASTTDGSKLENCYIPMGGSAMPYTKQGLREGKHKIYLKNEDIFIESATNNAKYCIDTLKENNIKPTIYTPSFNTVNSHEKFLQQMSQNGADISTIYSAGISSVAQEDKMRCTGAASSGLSFVSAIENNFIKSKDKVAICAYGSGVTSSLAVINIK